MLLVGGATIVLLLLGLWVLFSTRKAVRRWRNVAFPGLVVILAFAWQISFDGEAILYSVTAVVTALVVAAVSFLLPLNARKIVLADLSSEVVESDLTLTFAPRNGSALLEVGPDSVGVSKDTPSDDRFYLTVALSDVSAVTAWTEVKDTTWAIPNDEDERTVSLPAGDLLGISVPVGQLVVAVEDTAKVRRFLEARVALEHEQAAAVDD
jgi:hypothetical protein